jgi:hypothetical protein
MPDPDVVTAEPDLGNLIPASAASAARIAVPVIAAWLTLHAGLTPGTASADAAQGVTALLTLGSVLWGLWTTRLHAKQRNAAAATGDPAANPSDPVVVAKIKAAIADPASPIKGATH